MEGTEVNTKLFSLAWSRTLFALTLFALPLTPLLTRVAEAASYYVAPAGSDGAAGDSAHPWKTLQYAVSQVRPGDVVKVLPGDYVGFDLRGEQSGTANAPITFLAQSGARITQRNYTTPDGINLEGASYVVIDGFEVNGMPRAGIRSVANTGVVIRNNRCDANTRGGSSPVGSNNLLIENNITALSQNCQPHATRRMRR